MRMFTQLAGKMSTRNLERENLRALTLGVSAMMGVKLVGAERPFEPRALEKSSAIRPLVDQFVELRFTSNC